MHLAAVRGLGLVVRLLLNAGADIAARDELQLSTPLHNAARWGQVAAARRLAYASAAATSTSLTAAAAAGRAPSGAASVASEAHQSLNAMDANYKTPLFLAAEQGQPQVVEVLLAAGADFLYPDIKGLSPLHAAAAKGHSGVVKALAAARPTYQHLNNSNNLQGMTPLCCAAKAGHAGAVKALIEAGASLQLQSGNAGWTPMLYAAERGHAAVVKLLLTAGVRVDEEVLTYQRTPLFAAVIKGHEEVAQLLLEGGASIGTQGTEHASAVSRLGNSGGVLYFGTLLHYCVYWKYRDACAMLLRLGVGANVRDRKQQTPLHLAAAGDVCECMEYVRLLLDAGADPRAQDTYGRTALHVAVRVGDTAIVAALLAAGAGADVEDEYGDTPLAVAVASKHMISACELLLAGGDVEELEGVESEGLQEQLLKHLRRVEGGLKQKVQLLRSIRYNLRLLLLRSDAAGKFQRAVEGVGGGGCGGRAGGGGAAGGCGDGSDRNLYGSVGAIMGGGRVVDSRGSEVGAPSNSSSSSAGGIAPSDGISGADAVAAAHTWVAEARALVQEIGYLKGELERLQGVGPQLQEVIVSVADAMTCSNRA
jgi:ankyrin repeat protein